jgi:hypothetical protein
VTEAGWSSETGRRGAEAKSSSPQHCKSLFYKDLLRSPFRNGAGFFF